MDFILDLLTWANVKDTALWGLILRALAEFYSSVRNKGGLRNIILRFWFGENVPAVVAEDYKKELAEKQPLL